MRVIVDARTVYSPVRRGTGKNLIDLYRAMAALKPEWSFQMLHRQRPPSDDPFKAYSNVSAHAVDIKGDRWNLWEQVRLPLAALQGKASVLHSPANTAPAVSIVPLVMTIHDLIPLEGRDSAEARAWKANVVRGAKRARRVITPSAYTQRLLSERLQIPPEKIVVNHWAQDRACRRVTDPQEIERVCARYGLAGGQAYIFGFAAADPRKNTARIIEAWAGLQPALRSQFPLLLVGLQEPALTQMRHYAENVAPGGGWHLSAFAAEEDMPALMSGATMLCYPSLSEGFGLPVLDAFACGTVVVTSNTTSLPEVAGDAAVLVNPADVSAIRAAIEQVATDAGLRDRLRARGYERLQAFSWDRCARTAADTLEAAA